MAQAPTVQLPKRLPLVLEPENRGSSTEYDARIINAYLEKRGEEYWIFERFGTDEQSRPPAANATGRGIFNWKGNIYSIFADTLYKDGVAVAGTVDTTNGNYRFDSCLGATPKLQLGNGVKAYNYDAGGGLVLINDADFPTSFVKGWAFINGTTYVGTPSATIQGDDVNDPVNWDPLNVILAYIEPDQGMALNKQLVNAVFFKQWSGEVFYDAGNATGSPLGRVEGAKFNWGCLSADGVRNIDGALFWPGSSKDGNPEVLMLNNLKIETISTPSIERLLQGADFSAVYSWSLKLDGHKFYVLTLKNNNLTLAYDVEGPQGHRWSQWKDVNGNYLPIVDSCINSSNQVLLQHESNGRIYIASNSYATDDGDLITVDLYTANFDGGTRRGKNQKMLKFVSDQQVGSQLKLRWNDHDYDPTKWTNFRTIDLSKKDPFTTDMGTYVRRVHHLRHSCPVRMPRIQALEVQLDLCTL